MSTISLLDLDQSDRLAKRYAYLAANYFDHPEDAHSPAAKIPLENLFRMLQMFRYDSFSDEPRSGILELDSESQPIATEERWHYKIETALKSALSDAFGNAPKEKAVDEVQAALRWLATNNNAPAPDVRQRAKIFFERFLTALA